uniref:Wu:fj16a03 n=1 Tax=Mesocestoides corti TaxID=53468 RepID=A0A5K3G2R0_MESCO
LSDHLVYILFPLHFTCSDDEKSNLLFLNQVKTEKYTSIHRRRCQGTVPRTSECGGRFSRSERSSRQFCLCYTRKCNSVMCIISLYT